MTKSYAEYIVFGRRNTITLQNMQAKVSFQSDLKADLKLLKS